MSRTNPEDGRPLYQHITIIGDIGYYEVEVDEDPLTVKRFRRYNDALFYVVQFLANCALEHGGLTGKEEVS